MADLRTTFIKQASSFHNFFSVEKLLEWSEVRLIIPFYHAISDDYLAHISPLYPVRTVSEFKRDLDFYQENFELCSVADLYEQPSNKNAKPKFILSFDDGLSEMYDVVMPILDQRGLKAIFFLNSDFIDNQKLFYRYKLGLLLNELKKGDERISISKSDLLNLSFSDQEEIDRVASQLGIDFQDYLRSHPVYLTSEQIFELIDRGHFVGAHSRNHPYYSEISEDDQLSQTTDSLEYISEKFGLNDHLFAFPFTDDQVKNSFYERLHRRYYDILTFGTAGLKNDPIRHHYQRISMEIPTFSSEQVIKGELLYISLRKLFGMKGSSRHDRI